VWVLVALLGAAVVAGGFLLPRGDDGTNARLALAARRTLAAPGYRLIIHGPNGSTGHEEFQAPDRVRTTSRVDGRDFETIVIGDTLYGTASCSTPSGTATGHSEQHVEHGDLFGTGRQLLTQAAATPHATRTGADVYEYSFRLTVPRRLEKKIHLAPVRIQAHLDHGRVRELVVHWRQDHRSTTTRMTFAFDHVPRITAPAGPPLDMSRCSFGFTTN
jgi:hypothetical protein